MFSIESWPDPLTGDATATNGPRVRAARLEDALAHLPREDIDMVVWTRSPPADWTQSMRELSSGVAPLDYSGTVSEMTQAVAEWAESREYPVFLGEDIVHCVSLAAALSGSNRLGLTLTTGAAGNLPQPTGRLSLFCAYGHGDASWSSSGQQGRATATRFAPFCLAFMPGRHEPRLHLALDLSSSGLTMLVIAF